MTPKALVAGLQYLTTGWCPIPVSIEKRPLVPWSEFQTRQPTEEELCEWFTRWPLAGVGLVCGAISRLVVVDVDPRNGAGGAALAHRLPKTVTVRSGGGGLHYYFALHPGERVKKVGTLLAGVDLQAEAACITAPPSCHRSGQRYRFEPGLGFGEVRVAALPVLIRDLVAIRRRQAARPVFPRERHSGELKLETVLARLDGVRRHGAQWTARCPAHDDREPSLSVTTGTRGHVLLYCHAGCAFSEIRRALRDGVPA